MSLGRTRFRRDKSGNLNLLAAAVYGSGLLAIAFYWTYTQTIVEED